MKKSARIALIYDFLKELGGLERMMFFHANKLKKICIPGLFFSYVSEEEKEKIIKELELDENLPVTGLGSSKSEIIALALSFLNPSRILKINTDLIISYSFMSSVMALKKKEKNNTPYMVIICHPPNFLYPTAKSWVNSPSRLLAKLLGVLFGGYLKKKDIQAVKNADLAVSISKYTADRVQKIYGLKTDIIYPPISSFFKLMSEKKRKQFIKEKNLRPFLYAHGRIIPDKNFKVLLGIMAKLKGYNLLISGTTDKKYGLELEEEIRDLGIQERVKLLGRISKEDLLGYYNSAALFLMPTEREDFGLTMVEALACGCPVISWDDGAGPSEIVSKEGGMLAKPYDLEDFRDKIEKALKIKWNRKKVAESAKKFSADEVSKKFLSVVGNLIEKKVRIN